ncbi:efflux RND transporter periplasmic adaptor subunit [Luteolibacter ambystomatis]|uniref:Efflux RND transporter periplasmic adaptor subunit n=1 Tax=Luteolibacter ambystomatis TaxID=2824561 RepID=A0A975G789_9BACT|nr:efflux RND transporter periplasmic adaptor subunit [Luteolibacter ambystomatis]QUE50379.1 efflux RND transporter periplasmic adaptor subunit [Luteolibacter ambystomatis]
MTEPNPPAKRSSPLKPILWLLVLGGLGYGGWHWYQKRAATQKGDATSGAVGPGGGRRGQASGPVTVATDTAKEMDFEEWSTVSGTVTPLNVVTVRSRVDGELLKVNFTEGATVKKDDLLAEIDPKPYQVLLDQAKGQKLRDEALEQNAQADLKRYQTLLAQDSIAKQQVDTQESLVRQYKAAIESDTAAVEAAQLQLDYTKVLAPLTGRVGLRQVDPGNLIRASDTNGLVTITQMDPMGLIFAVPQDLVPTLVGYLNTKTEVPVEALSADQRTVVAKGKLLTSDNQINPTSGTLKLKAEFPNPDGKLFPNQFVNVRVRVRVEPKSVVVPAGAVQESSRGRYVYIVNPDQSVSFRQVETGATYREITRIVKGLSLGEQVVVSGLDRLRDGSKIVLASPGGSEGGGGHKHGEKPAGDETAKPEGERKHKRPQ